MPLPGVPRKQYLFLTGGSFDVHARYRKSGTKSYRAKVCIRQHLHAGGSPMMVTSFETGVQVYSTKREALTEARAMKKSLIAKMRSQRR